MTIDEAHDALRAAHWTEGDMAIQDEGKLVWHFYCRRR